MDFIRPPSDLKNRQTGQGDIYRIYVSIGYPCPIYMHIFCPDPFVLPDPRVLTRSLWEVTLVLLDLRGIVLRLVRELEWN